MSGSQCTVRRGVELASEEQDTDPIVVEVSEASSVRFQELNATAKSFGSALVFGLMWLSINC